MINEMVLVPMWCHLPYPQASRAANAYHGYREVLLPMLPSKLSDEDSLLMSG